MGALTYKILILIFFPFAFAEFANYSDFCAQCVISVNANCYCGIYGDSNPAPNLYGISCDGQGSQAIPTFIKNSSECFNISFIPKYNWPNNSLVISIYNFAFEKIPAYAINFTSPFQTDLHFENIPPLTFIDPQAFQGVDAYVFNLELYVTALPNFPFEAINNIKFVTSNQVTISIILAEIKSLDSSVSIICNKVPNLNSFIVFTDSLREIMNGTFTDCAMSYLLIGGRSAGVIQNGAFNNTSVDNFGIVV